MADTADNLDAEQMINPIAHSVNPRFHSLNTGFGAPAKAIYRPSKQGLAPISPLRQN
jgi:hypothetical protein